MTRVYVYVYVCVCVYIHICCVRVHLMIHTRYLIFTTLYNSPTDLSSIRNHTHTRRYGGALALSLGSNVTGSGLTFTKNFAVSVCVCMYVCIYVPMCVHVYVCMYVYICVCAHVQHSICIYHPPSIAVYFANLPFN